MKLGLGFMRHSIDSTDGQYIVDYAMSHGINYFESCYFYMEGQCEEYIYSLLSKYNREDYKICGKMPIKNFLPYENYKDVFETQLKRVPGHYFDYYLLQAVDLTCSYTIFSEQLIPFFLDQKKKGTIKKFGLSIQCDPNTLEQYLALKCWDIVQMPLNIYDWFYCFSETNYEIIQKYNLPIIAQAPLKGGNTLKYCSLQESYDFFSNLNIEYILLGTSSFVHFKDNITAFNNISSISLNILQEKITNYLKTTKIPCLYCRSCYLECPQKIPIPFYFYLYNQGLQNKTQFLDLAHLKSFTGEPCNECTHCNKCIEVCPQELNIPDLFFHIVWELRG